LPEEIPKESRLTAFYQAEALPTYLDWRQQNGYNWMTSVKDQGSCASCVAFGSIGAFEAQLKIQANNPSWNIDLSEQHLFSCGGGKCSQGWYVSSALNYLRDYGTPDESCSPYQGGDVACANSCPDWQSRAYKISSWNWLDTNPSSIEAALQSGPVIARFDVYADFFDYQGGVYHHTSGELQGGHAVPIVGYDSVQQYWIAKNSWGANWGENGYFRIGFGESGIEQAVTSIAVSVVAAPPPAPTISLSPTTASNGDTVLVSGSGFSLGDTDCTISSSPDNLISKPACTIASGQVSGSFTVTFGSSGTYTVTVKGTTGDTGTASLTVSTQPYASRVTAITVVPDPSNVGQGSKMIFTVSVRNSGTKDMSTAKIQLNIYRPDKSLAASPNVSISNFLAGTERIVQVTYTLPSSGPLGAWTYDVSVYRVNYNTATLLSQLTGEAFTVQPPDVKGLLVSVIDSPDPVGRGKTATFTVRIKNIGGNLIWPSAKISIKIYKPDGSQYTTLSLTVKDVMPGTEYTYNMKWTTSYYASKGTYRYDVYFYYGTTLIDSKTGFQIKVQ